MIILNLAEERKGETKTLSFSPSMSVFCLLVVVVAVLLLPVVVLSSSSFSAFSASYSPKNTDVERKCFSKILFAVSPISN